MHGISFKNKEMEKQQQTLNNGYIDKKDSC